MHISKQWTSYLRQHNKVRKALEKKKHQKEKMLSEKAFKNDPNKFAEKLFQNKKASGTPKFSASTAQQYFETTYTDANRDYEYTPLPEMVRPTLPESLFSIDCPNLGDIKHSIRKKRNKAAACLNALTYVPYKKCPAILKFILQLFRKIWKTKDIPTDWACAYIVLLSKSENFSQVSEFRPIAITSTVSKIFFSIISSRLQIFFIKNRYIRREVQKGFLTGVSGCLEHVFALMEALKEAKGHSRQIVITWLDLANAYGSVRHNLIQFALNWYHVPLHIQELIFDYYEKLCAVVITNEWSTGFFLLDIGLFQGCVLSTILFDCVFQLLLDFLSPSKKLGYTFKALPEITMHTKAYADDLTLLSKNAVDNQFLCDQTNLWLQWTITMNAKPSKCVSLGLKMFQGSKNERFTPLFQTVYSPFDPLLSINGQPIKFIISPTEKDPFKAAHFKFLGRWIHYSLSDERIKERICASLIEDINIVENSQINGFMKLWLYQFYVLSRLSWPFLIYDFDRSFVLEMQKAINPKLKGWAGVSLRVENGLLFRAKENFGLVSLLFLIIFNGCN